MITGEKWKKSAFLVKECVECVREGEQALMDMELWVGEKRQKKKEA
jgi:hypothetical protein